MNKLTILSYGAGIIVIISSIIRWFIIYNDQSQMILGVSIGILILGGAYVYERLRKLDLIVSSFEKRLDGIGELVSRMEWSKRWNQTNQK